MRGDAPVIHCDENWREARGIQSRDKKLETMKRKCAEEKKSAAVLGGGSLVWASFCNGQLSLSLGFKVSNISCGGWRRRPLLWWTAPATAGFLLGSGHIFGSHPQTRHLAANCVGRCLTLFCPRRTSAALTSNTSFAGQQWPLSWWPPSETSKLIPKYGII